MASEPYFIYESGSDFLAISHTWTVRREMEEVGYVQENGRYRFDRPDQLRQEDNNHEWIAYCGGCGNGLAMEWLPENRVKVIREKREVSG